MCLMNAAMIKENILTESGALHPINFLSCTGCTLGHAEKFASAKQLIKKFAYLDHIPSNGGPPADLLINSTYYYLWFVKEKGAP